MLLLCGRVILSDPILCGGYSVDFIFVSAVGLVHVMIASTETSGSWAVFGTW